MNPPTIAFCGPIAPRIGPATGGMESGSRGIIFELERRGYRTVEYPYPLPDRHAVGLSKGLAYAFGLSRIALRLIAGTCRFDVLHLTILYRHFLYAEWVFLMCARLRGKPVVLHVRPGDWWLQYQRRSSLYRAIFRAVVRGSHIVAVEGHGLLDRMHGLGVRPLHVPSFVTEAPRRRDIAPSENDGVALVYAGALNDAKGLPIALEARRLLERAGVPATLTIAGYGERTYVAGLQASYPEHEVRWVGPIPHSEVRPLARRAHFFLFATTFVGEGHSNALNECMAEGVVPIVSDHGENRYVVADTGIVLSPRASAEDYAAAVERIWRSGEWAVLSDRCVERIRRCFHGDVVIHSLLDAYAKLAADRVTH